MLVNHLTINDLKLVPVEIKNIQEYIKMDFQLTDLRLSLLQDLVQLPNATLKTVMADAEISMMLLRKMWVRVAIFSILYREMCLILPYFAI